MWWWKRRCVYACLKCEKARKLGPKGRAAFVRRKDETKRVVILRKVNKESKGKKPTYSKTGA